MTSTLERLKAITVFIAGPDGTGTGYLVSSNRIATANHVVRSWRDGERFPVMVGIEGVTRQAHVLKRDLATDAALLGIDSSVDAIPFPIGTGLVQNMTWEGYGFPQSSDNAHNPSGLPLDGLIKDPATRNNVGQRAVLLYSDMAAAGNASPLNGFSGSAVVVADTLVGHLTKQMGDVDDQRRPRYGYVFACPIECVAALFDFTPNTALIRTPIARIVSDDGTLEQYRSAYVSFALEALTIQVTDGQVREMTQSFQSLRRNLAPLVSLGEKATESSIDACIGGRGTLAARARWKSAYVAGTQRSRSIKDYISDLEDQATTLTQKVQQSEALQPPYKPTQDQLPLSGMSVPVTDQRTTDYLRQVEKYEAAVIAYRRLKDEIPANRQQLSQIEEKIRQQEIELSRFEEALEANLFHLEREIEVARGQDIAQCFAVLRDVVRHDLNDASGAPRAFAQILICNAGAIVARPWTNDSLSVFEATVKDIHALMKQAVREFPIEIALDCLTRYQTISESLERNRATLNEIDSALARSSRKNLEVALSEVRKLRALPLPPATPPKAKLLARTDYEQLFKAIDVATEQIETLRQQLYRHSALNASLLKEVQDNLEVADQMRERMLSSASRTKVLFDDFSLIWVMLCRRELISLLPRNVFDFIKTVQTEVERRHSLTSVALVELCQSTRFLLADAEAHIRDHPTVVLLREYQALLNDFSTLEALSATYATARAEATKAASSMVAKIWRLLKR